ncbi:hypothetical protein [Devosia sp.]|uniref:hypothetical protein n=1 Tax=Devosia sp. TaxID=1871048 RepID=UPI002FC8B8A7
MAFAKHPHLKDLCLAMACANGGINRNRPERDFLRTAERIVFDLGHAPEDMAAIEGWLSGLPDAARLSLADGEYTENQAILATAPCGPFLDAILDRVFEEAV